MLTSLALIFLVGLSMAAICKRIKLPGIIGMLFTGIVLGPYVLDLLDASILGISGELRKIALVIILIKAGLSLNLHDLKKVGRPALMMAFVPATFEMTAYILFAPLFLGVSRTEAAVMGAVLSAVSPAVVVPRMVELMEKGYGTKKGIPQMILAGASLDDVFVIVLFSTFLGMAEGGPVAFAQFLDVPVSIVTGILLGAAAGVALAWFFETNYAHDHLVRNSMKVIILLGTAFLLLAVEEWVKPYAAVSGLLAVMSMALAVAMRSTSGVTKRLQEKFGKLWIAAEVILFVLVGAAVDIRYTLTAGAGAVVMILTALCIRAIGVMICMVGTKLNAKEKLYCVLAYMPKATVQAAIGSVPLAMGLNCGKIVLSAAVLGILITAPLGALAMDMSYRHCLEREMPGEND